MVERADASTEQLVDRDWFSVIALVRTQAWNRREARHSFTRRVRNYGPKRECDGDARRLRRPSPRRSLARPSTYLPHDTTPKTISTSLPSASPLVVHRARHPRCRPNRLRPRGRCGRGLGRGLGRGRRGARPVGSPDATDSSNRGSRQDHRERDTRQLQEEMGQRVPKKDIRASNPSSRRAAETSFGWHTVIAWHRQRSHDERWRCFLDEQKASGIARGARRAPRFGWRAPSRTVAGRARRASSPPCASLASARLITRATITSCTAAKPAACATAATGVVERAGMLRRAQAHRRRPRRERQRF